MSELRFLESGFREPLPQLPDLQAQRHGNPLKIRKPKHPSLSVYHENHPIRKSWRSMRYLKRVDPATLCHEILHVASAADHQPVCTQLDTVVFDRIHCAAPTVQQTVRRRSVWDSMENQRLRTSCNTQSRNGQDLDSFFSPHGVLKCSYLSCVLNWLLQCL